MPMNCNTQKTTVQKTLKIAPRSQLSTLGFLSEDGLRYKEHSNEWRFLGVHPTSPILIATLPLKVKLAFCEYLGWSKRCL